MTEGKVCTKCGVWKGLGEFSPSSNNSLDSRCKCCRRIAAAERFAAKNPTKRIEIDKKRQLLNSGIRQCNKCRLFLSVDEYHKRGSRPIGLVSTCKACKAKLRSAAETQNNKSRNKGYCEELTDNYVAWSICQRANLRPKDIPIDLIKAKREHIRLQRLVKELQQAQPKEPK